MLFPTDGQSKVYLGLSQTARKHQSDKQLLIFSCTVVVAVGDILWAFFLRLLLLVVSDSILLLLLFGHDSVALAGILQRVTSTHLCGHKKSTPYCYVIFMTRPMVYILKCSKCCKHMNSSSATKWSIQHLFQVWDTVMMLTTCLPCVNTAYWILFKLSLLGTMFPRLLASATSSV